MIVFAETFNYYESSEYFGKPGKEGFAMKQITILVAAIFIAMGLVFSNGIYNITGTTITAFRVNIFTGSVYECSSGECKRIYMADTDVDIDLTK